MEKQTTVDRLGEIYSVHDPVRDKREMYVHRIPGNILKIGVGPSGAPFPLSSPLHFFFRPTRQPTVYIVFSRTGEYDLSNVSNENGEGGGEHFSILIYACQQAWVEQRSSPTKYFG